MTASLRYQTVYCKRDRMFKPATLSFLAVSFLLIVLVFKIWIKVSIVDVAYEIAEVKKENRALIMKKQELELQQSVLLRPDNIKQSLKQMGFRAPTAEQIISIK